MIKVHTIVKAIESVKIETKRVVKEVKKTAQELHEVHGSVTIHNICAA